MGELREFVYIDDSSLNSNLSSLGRGLPSEIIQSTEGETEKSGKAGGTILGVGAQGKYAGIDRNAIETTLEITAPYRYQDLLNCLEEDEIEIYENPDPRSVSRGDVVRINGKARPMSLFKFEVGIQTVRNLLNTKMQNSLAQLEGAEDMDSVGVDELETIQDLVQQLTGDKLPLKMETESGSYGIALERGNMRVSAAKAFLEEQDYTLFGRVKRRILGDDSWDPIQATSVINRYMPQDSTSEEMRNGLEEVANETNIQIGPEDWELSGHTATIQPIAMYW